MERKFLMVFGMDRFRYADQEEFRGKLMGLIQQGPKYGIHIILWASRIDLLDGRLGTKVDPYFAQRIVFTSNPETMERLVDEHDSGALKETTAVYLNNEEDIKNTHFRIYKNPSRTWVEKYAEIYMEEAARRG